VVIDPRSHSRLPCVIGPELRAYHHPNRLRPDCLPTVLACRSGRQTVVRRRTVTSIVGFLRDDSLRYFLPVGCLRDDSLRYFRRAGFLRDDSLRYFLPVGFIRDD